jgi:hypothetical protein
VNSTRVLLIGFEPAERARICKEQTKVEAPIRLDSERAVYDANEIERSFSVRSAPTTCGSFEPYSRVEKLIAWAAI